MQQPTTPPHPPLNTVSHRRKRVVTSLRHAGVSVRGSGGQRGIVDTLLPYVRPGCSASAGLLKHRLPPRFLTRLLPTDGLQRSSETCILLQVLPARSGTRLLSHECLLPSAAVPAAGSGSVGFPHSANFIQTSFSSTGQLRHFLIRRLPRPAAQLSRPFLLLACVPHVRPHMCVC